MAMTRQIPVVLLAALALSVLASLHTQLRQPAFTELSTSYVHRDDVELPCSSSWGEAENADTAFLGRAPQQEDAPHAQLVALATSKRIARGATGIHLGCKQEALHPGSSIKVRTPLANEVAEARAGKELAVGSLEKGFGGGDSMRPHLLIGNTVKRMVNNDLASVEYMQYRAGESGDGAGDDSSGVSVTLGARDVKRGATLHSQPARGTERSDGHGGNEGQPHIILPHRLLGRKVASVAWHSGERAADAHVTHKFAGRPGVSLGRRVRKEQSASMTVRQPLNALEARIDSIDAGYTRGYGGVGGRPHFSIGRGINSKVRRHLASVTWRDSETSDGTGGGHFVGRPKVRLGARDKKNGAYIRKAKATEDADEVAEQFRPRVVLGHRVARGAYIKGPLRVSGRKRHAEDDGDYGVAMPRIRSITVNRNTDFTVNGGAKNVFQGPRNLLPPDRVAYYDNMKTLQVTDAKNNTSAACSPGSMMCSLIKNLNKIHLAGVENFGGRTWTPTSEAANNANWAKFDEQGADVSLCQHCVTKFLADAGPARWLVGRSIAAQARKGTCAAFCEKNPTQNIPVAT